MRYLPLAIVVCSAAICIALLATYVLGGMNQ